MFQLLREGYKKIKKEKKVWSTHLSKVGEVSKVAQNDPDPGMGISRPFFLTLYASITLLQYFQGMLRWYLTLTTTRN